jgi:hypothetical protein
MFMDRWPVAEWMHYGNWIRSKSATAQLTPTNDLFEQIVMLATYFDFFANML